MSAARLSDDMTLAQKALRRGASDEALRRMRSAGAAETMPAPALLLWGLAAFAEGATDEAARVWTLGAARDPANAFFPFNLARVATARGERASALAFLQHATELAPTFAEAFANWAEALIRAGRWDEALARAEHALTLGIDRAAGLNLKALALAGQGAFALADTAWAEALALTPDNASCWANRANAAVDARAFPTALRFFAAARALDDAPLFRRDEGMARLLCRDEKAGWPLYEARLEVRNTLQARPACPRYAGEPLAGKTLLLVAEQGFGDTLHFCRYGASLAAQGAALVWVVQPALARLLQANLPGKVVAAGDVVPPADFYVPLLSLPLAFGAAWRDPARAYLRPRTEIAPLDRPTIGIVWAGSPTHRRDAERSIALDLLRPVWEAFPSLAFVALSKGDNTAVLAACGAPMVDSSPRLTDFADTAALVARLAAVVSVDTALLHLAGALGVPTIGLLPYAPDWRWGIEDGRAPCYDSLTLCRQTAPGRWDSVLAAVRDCLKEKGL
jgi:tetratricopeptide (TPR) repeat protein